jgi:ribosomal protein L30, bacterial/organelle
MARIKVTLIKSTLGRLKAQKANAAALGLNKVGVSKIHEDNPVIRGMIGKIAHMVTVEDVKE